jgi:hypothetical protein
MSGGPLPGSTRATLPSPEELFGRFRGFYDACAADVRTELGLFYERHYKFVQYEQLLDTRRPEYFDREWNRVFSAFLAALGREFGFVPARPRVDEPGMVWYWPSTPMGVGAVFEEVNEARPSILTREVPQLVRDEPPLSVLIMYPDYPLAPGTLDLAASSERWRVGVEQALTELRARGHFLLLTISAYSWELPSTWAGFAWDPTSARLEAVSRR